MSNKLTYMLGENKPNPYICAAISNKIDNVVYLRHDVFKLRTLSDRSIENFVWFAEFEREYYPDQTKESAAWGLMVINEAKRRGLRRHGN